ncbi:hypothetical protein ELH75_01200 [Rhizobium leguminosarum]|uniref:hypothetical protein n=1 Tax=Rhizobium leguminosarum TaxID=384 RepID=UPI001031C345|nr:hypothetical protein [Rhizobium leguminosarum]TAX99802.1 hypothetical protein ELH95_00985 [Rhizobium leguminosarum]TAZ59947.1 hypothetical protein ELH75_01200 [Rhizobium leguminosarum]
MQLINSVSQVNGYLYDDSFGSGFLLVSASGTVSEGGWTRFRLVPRYYSTPPANGIWEFDFVGDEPRGEAYQIQLPVSVFDIFYAPPWVTTLRVYSASGSMDHQLAAKGVQTATQFVQAAVLYRRDLATYDDSIQPTGTIHWDGFTPHVEMKKLHHVLYVVIEGPDQTQIDNCFRQAATAAIIAAIIAAYATGGLALGAAVNAFVTALTACLGASYNVRTENNSHWIYWDT